MSEPLDIQEIKRHLDETMTLGAQFLLFESVNSTNEYAKQNVEVNGTVVLAEKQTAGRGRLGRDWVAPAGKGILMSVVLLPEPGFSVPLLNLAAGVAVSEALQSLYSMRSVVRWPNDVFASRKKIAGVLAETQFRGSDLSKFILGIGLNVLQKPGDFPDELRKPATSVKQETSLTIDRNLLTAGILKSLDSKIHLLESGNSHLILQEWRARTDQIGRLVKYISNKEEKVGIFKDLAKHGAVILESDGHQAEITSGEIILLE
ncbi:MAG: biotin--[acetyl-CoA-carboxylase] ligase [Candidatus Marinimicrobia bacterium]|nr:biotin--[acetyl-CoA-carboxylase] ligase [Candidatus Neomarinimicrobiota bacterium]